MSGGNLQKALAPIMAILLGALVTFSCSGGGQSGGGGDGGDGGNNPHPRRNLELTQYIIMDPAGELSTINILENGSGFAIKAVIDGQTVGITEEYIFLWYGDTYNLIEIQYGATGEAQGMPIYTTDHSVYEVYFSHYTATTFDARVVDLTNMAEQTFSGIPLPAETTQSTSSFRRLGKKGLLPLETPEQEKIENDFVEATESAVECRGNFVVNYFWEFYENAPGAWENIKQKASELKQKAGEMWDDMKASFFEARRRYIFDPLTNIKDQLTSAWKELDIKTYAEGLFPDTCFFSDKPVYKKDENGNFQPTHYNTCYDNEPSSNQNFSVYDTGTCSNQYFSVIFHARASYLNNGITNFYIDDNNTGWLELNSPPYDYWGARYEHSFNGGIHQFTFENLVCSVEHNDGTPAPCDYLFAMYNDTDTVGIDPISVQGGVGVIITPGHSVIFSLYSGQTAILTYQFPY